MSTRAKSKKMSREDIATLLNEEVMTTGELSARTGYSGPTIINWSHRFENFPEPIGKKGKATLYLWSEFAAWVATWADEDAS